MRKIIFAKDEYYHVYNRGVDKRDVFLDDADFLRFLRNLREFNNELLREERIRLAELSSESELSSVNPNSSGNFGNPEECFVEIVAYCLNPNHFHLILKQVSQKGIEKFMHKVSTGYTNYFNRKYERSGSLFQGPFKAIHIDSNEYLLYLSAYVNRNYFIHGYQEGSLAPMGAKLPSYANEWKYCSVLDYIGKRGGTLCEKNIILNQFAIDPELSSGSAVEYGKFLNENSLFLKRKKELEKYCLE
jgi:putative transposase